MKESARLRAEARGRAGEDCGQGGVREEGGEPGPQASARGSVKVNVAPWPGWLAAVIVPP